MSVNIEKIKRLNDLVSLSMKTKHTLILNPEEKSTNKEKLGKNVEYDEVEWKISEKLKSYVDELSNNNQLNIEDKILQIFEKICKDYVYDDNLISYIKKVDDDVFSLPDWYGRNIDSEWEKNREEHNRRVCFELSRYLAKALSELLKYNDDYNICILWNKNLIHYFVGVTCRDYSITLDTDDFFNIKDLTRIKTDLTAEGIKILEDKYNKFEAALNKFNEGRSKYAIKKMEDQINDESALNEESGINGEQEENDDVVFLRKVMEILSQKYEIDSQGIYEYIKEIVDIKIGSEKREKIWKKIEGTTKESTRYIRCLVLNMDNKKYLVDVEQKMIRLFDEKEFEQKRSNFVPYNNLNRGGFDYYDGR